MNIGAPALVSFLVFWQELQSIIQYDPLGRSNLIGRPVVSRFLGLCKPVKFGAPAVVLLLWFRQEFQSIMEYGPLSFGFEKSNRSTLIVPLLAWFRSRFGNLGTSSLPQYLEGSSRTAAAILEIKSPIPSGAHLASSRSRVQHLLRGRIPRQRFSKRVLWPSLWRKLTSNAFITYDVYKRHDRLLQTLSVTLAVEEAYK